MESTAEPPPTTILRKTSIQEKKSLKGQESDIFVVTT
jgi:hypothetical protein